MDPHDHYLSPDVFVESQSERSWTCFSAPSCLMICALPAIVIVAVVVVVVVVVVAVVAGASVSAVAVCQCPSSCCPCDAT